MALVNDETKVISPSRTYVAICIKTNFNGYYFKKFTLPETSEDPRLVNNASYASWYFLNRLDGIACIAGVMPYEEYVDIKDV